MDDSVRYSCDASFEHPAALVFDGLLYERTMTPVDLLPSLNFARVVPDEQYQQDGGDEEVEDASTRYNIDLEFVVFNHFVYVRSDKDPATIEDGVLRTVALGTLFEHLQQMAAAAIFYAYGPPPPRAYVQGPPQQLNNTVRPLYLTRVMPQRALVKQLSALEPLFDLTPEERVGVNYIAPSHNNVTAPATPGMVANPTRTRWKDEHVAYLYELMELAMLQLNRQLYVSDFKAITEALHRRFRVIGGIPERGYNTVHSFATRRPAYNELVQRVLPDINFPDFVYKSGYRQQGTQNERADEQADMADEQYEMPDEEYEMADEQDEMAEEQDEMAYEQYDAPYDMPYEQYDMPFEQ